MEIQTDSLDLAIPKIVIADTFCNEIKQAVSELLKAWEYPIIITTPEEQELWNQAFPNIDQKHIFSSHNSKIYNWYPEKMDDFFKKNPTLSAAWYLLSEGIVDWFLWGKTYATWDIIKTLLRAAGVTIPEGKEKGTLSSHFLMQKNWEKILFADCGVIPYPTDEQLQDIADQTITQANMYNITPKVFLFEELQQKITICEDYLVNSISEANTFIFPDLDAGNICYKMFQYLLWYQAIGPIIQGLEKPWNDLSRWASSQDIKLAYEITKAQVHNKNNSEYSLDLPESEHKSIIWNVSNIDKNQNYLSFNIKWDNSLDLQFYATQDEADEQYSTIYSDLDDIETNYIGFLSFSTNNSARMGTTELINNRALLAQMQFKNAKVAWDTQFDAAFIPKIWESKFENNPLQGNSANIYILPNKQTLTTIHTLLKEFV